MTHPTLRIEPGDGEPIFYTLSKESVTIGRAEDNDLVLDHESVSATHAIIEGVGSRRLIRDRGSWNGIKVNGFEIHEFNLNDGDKIEIGSCHATFTTRAIETFEGIEAARVSGFAGSQRFAQIRGDCPHCGPVVFTESAGDGTVAVCPHCRAPLGKSEFGASDVSPRVTPPSLPKAAAMPFGRLKYLVAWIALVSATALANRYDQSGIADLLILAVFIVAVVLRLRDIGMSGWWALMAFIPILNAILGIRLFSAPTGYQIHRQADLAMKIIIGSVLGLLAIGILLLAGLYIFSK